MERSQHMEDFLKSLKAKNFKLVSILYPQDKFTIADAREHANLWGFKLDQERKGASVPNVAPDCYEFQQADPAQVKVAIQITHPDGCFMVIGKEVSDV